MNTLDVVEPLSCFTFFVELLIQTLLSQVLQHNFFALYRVVRWLYSTVFAPAVAVIFDVLLVTPNTLPEYVVRSENDVVSQLLLKDFKVLDEVDGAV